MASSKSFSKRKHRDITINDDDKNATQTVIVVNSDSDNGDDDDDGGNWSVSDEYSTRPDSKKTKVGRRCSLVWNLPLVIARVDYSRIVRLEILLDHADLNQLYQLLVAYCGLTTRRAKEPQDMTPENLYGLFERRQSDHYLVSQILAQLTAAELAVYPTESATRSNGAKRAAVRGRDSRIRSLNQFHDKKHAYDTQVHEIFTGLTELVNGQLTLTNFRDYREWDADAPHKFASVQLFPASAVEESKNDRKIPASPTRFPVLQVTWCDTRVVQYMVARIMRKKSAGSSWLVHGHRIAGEWPDNNVYPGIEYDIFNTQTLASVVNIAVTSLQRRQLAVALLRAVLPPELTSVLVDYLPSSNTIDMQRLTELATECLAQTSDNDD